MSTTFVEVVTIDHIKPHPMADRLEIAIIKGATCCVQKGTFKIGETVIYFPPDILIPEFVSDRLGVKNFLKHSDQLTGFSIPCRVAACRLRGQPSFGFIIPLSEGRPDSRDTVAIGGNISHWFDAQKFIPKEKLLSGDAAPEHTFFHRYTDIENYARYPDAIPVGLPVRVTEKLHGSNCRLGLIKDKDGFEFMAGSNKVRRKQPEQGQSCSYWKPLDNPNIIELLTDITDGQNNVVIFGEIYGSNVQDMDYGLKTPEFRVFDMTVNGGYVGWDDLKTACEKHNVPMVPLLYSGPFHHGLIEQFTYGVTTIADPQAIKSKFKDREGCVITPLIEEHCYILGGRMILKSVSADYLDRKGAQDNA